MEKTNQVHNIRNTSDFLFLFEEENGLKFLTHDILSCNLDFIRYVYDCEKRILEAGVKCDIPSDIYHLVQGFVFGPSWRDYQGRLNKMFISSEPCISFYENTGSHPLNGKEFQNDIDTFRHSIRFRNGRLYSFFEEIKEFFPDLRFTIKKNIKSADFYTDTMHIRNAITELLSCMNEFKMHKNVIINYEEDEISNPDYIICSLIIEQTGSFPSHAIEQDIRKIKAGGGTMANIRKSLLGYANWSIISRWGESGVSQKWNVLSDTYIPEIENVQEADGFKHIISVYQKKRKYDTSD